MSRPKAGAGLRTPTDETRRTLSPAMLLSNIDDLPDRCAPGTRLMGLDVGDKTIGMAVADGALMLASPVGTVRRTGKFRDDAAELLAAFDRHRVGGLVLGFPVNMDGSEGPRCQSVRQFAENLLGYRDVPIALWDERWSTMAVERAMIDADLSRKKRKQKVDTAAAAYILQGALDYLGSRAARRRLAGKDDAGEADDPDGETAPWR